MVRGRGRHGPRLSQRRAPEDQKLVSQPGLHLFILDLARPHRYLEIRGDAKIEPDTDYAFAAKVGAKCGSDVRDHDLPGQRRIVVTIDPVKVNAIDMTAG